MLFSDALTLDAPRRTRDGYLAVRAKAARTGAYQYSGREVDPENKHGLRDRASVNVLRDDATVFDEAAARSFIGKPVTNDHPTEAVTATNWRDHARGTIMGAMRDGDYLAFDLLLTDADAIAAVDGGKRELSNGYSSNLEFGAFKAADGTECQARQTSIAGNHIALVDRGRAGPECRIGDAKVCASLPQAFLDSLLVQENPVPKIMLIDGLSVDVGNADTAESTIKTIVAARDAATAKVTDLETQVATLKTEATTKDAKITTLEQQVKDAKPTPQQLRDAGKALMLAAGKAKALGVAVTDAMDEPAIMKAVVDAKMGDAAKGWNYEQVAASFAVLTKDAKVEDKQVQPLGTPVNLGDAETGFLDAQRKASEHRRNAWKTPATSATA